MSSSPSGLSITRRCFVELPRMSRGLRFMVNLTCCDGPWVGWDWKCRRTFVTQVRGKLARSHSVHMRLLATEMMKPALCRDLTLDGTLLGKTLLLQEPPQGRGKLDVTLGRGEGRWKGVRLYFSRLSHHQASHLTMCVCEFACASSNALQPSVGFHRSWISTSSP